MVVNAWVGVDGGKGMRVLSPQKCLVNVFSVGDRKVIGWLLEVDGSRNGKKDSNGG